MAKSLIDTFHWNEPPGRLERLLMREHIAARRDPAKVWRILCRMVQFHEIGFNCTSIDAARGSIIIWHGTGGRDGQD